jgi:hypothetical protein
MKDQITKAIHATLPIYLEDGADPYDINCGMCEEFAHEVLLAVGSSETLNPGAVWIEDLIDTPYPDANHKVIRWTSGPWVFYFDAECPEGTRDLSLLPVIANQGRTREEVIAARPQKERR